MCGIAGYCLNKPIVPKREQMDLLMQPLLKRGPDDQGICFISREQNTVLHFNGHNGVLHDIALFHTRFAILDLSDKGHQPFTSHDGSITAVFNGEIYNFIELRKELQSVGVVFKTQCDTEVLVEGYAFWRDSLWSKMNGFWAVCLYDRRSQSFILARDRIGVAPLYYRETSQGLFFSSYIESLVEIGGEKATVNLDVMSGFLQTGFKDIDGTTFYNEINTVPAATAVHLLKSQSLFSKAERRPYWFLPDARLTEKDISFDEAVKKFREIFFNAVDIRLRADVKVAFELSGGLDSSSIVAAAAAMGHDITTYTAKVAGADEEPYARFMQSKYKLDYRVISKVEDNFSKDVAAFSRLMEEPYDNPNAYTHYQMLKEMNAQGTKVVITGAGGDEVFAGYESSFWPKAYQEWKKEGVSSYVKADWYEFCRRFKTPQRSYDTLKHYLVRPWQKKSSAQKEGITTALKHRSQYDSLSFNEQRRFHFNVALLPYYMRSSDHFTLGIPVEHRFPLLDYRLIEFGMKLPISYLFCNGWTKYILRKAMQPYLPEKIVWRRQKMGFQFPYVQYLTAQRQVFEPVFKRAYPEYNYGSLLKSDPIALWRFISTAIWLENK
jgi:asparagine synthase (glutamine-hydrolysing)